MAKKKQPCEWCEDDSWSCELAKNGHHLCWEIYPDANYIGITSYANNEQGEPTELSITIPMKYCPNCGRKLEW